MTKNIFEYIKIVLPKHKCVVLPKFGAFILNKEDTKTFGASSSIVPPSYSISFNSRLQHDDGVLTSYLQAMRGISYEQASKELSKTINGLREELLLNKEIVCSTFGKIELTDSSIVFVQNKNYILPIYFGLSPVGLTCISSISENIAKETKTVSLRRRLIVAAASVAVVVLLTLPSANITDSMVDRSQQAGYLKSLVETTSVKTEELAAQPIIEEMQPEVAEEVKQQPVVQQAPVQQLPISSTGRTYYLILGGATSYDMAQKSLNNFRAEGFETVQLLTSADRYRIYLQAFDNMADAEKMTLKFRRDNPKYESAWVYSTRSR